MTKDMFDTIKYDELSPEGYKEQMKGNWNEAPCGSNYSDAPQLTIDYFNDIERYRYDTHPWLKKSIDSFDILEKEVLEIGFGMGTDHLNLARRGGIMRGIDMTTRNIEITRQRLKLYEYESDLITGDAENLPFPDNTIDFVYSFGVFHHIPNVLQAISEIHRVLRPGGRCWLAVYHKNSIFFWWTTFLMNYLLKGGWKKRTLTQQLSLIEYPNKNENLVVRLYKRKEFEQIFTKFSTVSSEVKHLIPADIAYFKRFVKDPYQPRPILDNIGRRFGWYVIVDAIK